MNFKIYAAIAIFIAATSLTISASAQMKPSLQAKEFVRKASIGNQFEIESSQIALKQTTTSAVKDFAQMMVTDHTQAGDQLKKALAASKLDIAPVKELDNEHKKIMDNLKAAPAQNFDEQYIKAQIDAHAEAVSLFKDYAESGDNADLKKFASDTLPTLEQHQEKVHNLKLTNLSAGP